MNKKARFYPIGISLEGKRVVVVGAGQVAERKIARLLSFGADVQVISPKATPVVEEWAETGVIQLDRRVADRNDARMADLLFLTANDGFVNDEIAAAAEVAGVPVNRADKPEDCDFILPSVLDQGGLNVAVFSDGTAPAFVKWVREKLESFLEAEIGDFGLVFAQFRDSLPGILPDQARRAAVLRAVLASDALEIYKMKGANAALERMKQILSHQT